MIKYDNNDFSLKKLYKNNIDKIEINMIPPNLKTLKIGCATGFISEYLKKEKNYFVYVGEYNLAQTNITKSKADIVIGVA
jgi:hypothetical protein